MRLAEVAELVGERDLERVERIAGEFHGLGCADGCAHLRSVHETVGLGEHVAFTRRSLPDDHEGWLVEIADREPFAHEFGIGHDSERASCSPTGGFLDPRDDERIDGAGQHRAPYGDGVNVPLVTKRRPDLAWHVFDVRSVRLSALLARRPHADEGEIRARDCLRDVRRRHEASRAVRLLEKRRQVRLEDGALASSEESELFRIDLHTDHSVTLVRETRGRDGADVAQPEGADSHFALTSSSVLTTVRAPLSQSKRSTDRRIAHRSQRRVSASRKAAARACESAGGTNSPLTPCSTISGTPPTRDATTGSPHAIASNATLGSPSLRLGRHSTSHAFIHLGMSRCS